MKRIIYATLVGLSILISVSACTEEPVKPQIKAAGGTGAATGLPG